MGAARVAGAERAVSVGDEIGGAERGGVRELAFHRFDSTVFPRSSVPSPVRDLLTVRGFDCNNEQFHLLPAARDKASAY